MQLAIIEYIELLFYRDRARSSLMFPKVSPTPAPSDVSSSDIQLKAMFCLLSYTVVVPGPSPLYVSTSLTPPKRADFQGAIKLVNVIFPPPERKSTPEERKKAQVDRAARKKLEAEATLKAEEEKLEKERAERRERHAKQAEYIEAHS